jgi:hypothetical protein
VAGSEEVDSGVVKWEVGDLGAGTANWGAGANWAAAADSEAADWGMAAD